MRAQRWAVLVAIGGLLLPSAAAQFESGSDGSDGMLSPLQDLTIDLSLADTGPGTGTYDPENWAVVFNHTTITIPSEVTVSFINHPSGAPLIWLAQGDVSIDGTVTLDGARGSSGSFYARPGPGAFAGGRMAEAGLEASGGFGPGGAMRGMSKSGGGGGYGTRTGSSGSVASSGATYGYASITPLIGGSGGSAGKFGSGGAGGGAILIASSTRITVDGTVAARGGNGGRPRGGAGSGGAIRLIARTVSCNGVLDALGGTAISPAGVGGNGRIRLEGDVIELAGRSNPAPSVAVPGNVFPPATAPLLRITAIAGQPVSPDPDAGILTTDVTINDDAPVTIEIETIHVTDGARIQVRIVPYRGNVFTVTSSPVAGGFATAEVSLSLYRSEIQLMLIGNDNPLTVRQDIDPERDEKKP